MTRSFRWLALASAPALLLACAPPEASADVILEGLTPSSIGALSAPRVQLVVLDEEGRSARMRTRAGSDAREVSVTSPVPVPCVDGSCQLSLGLAAGTYTFALHVFAQDRCGAEARVVTLSSEEGGVALAPNQRAIVELPRADYGFDDDGDGIENALELAVCGRVDVADRVWSPPTACGHGSSCCAVDDAGAPIVSSDLLGRATRFDGSDGHLLANGSTVVIEPFFLDATEVPWGALERCVAAGACLFGEPQHAARVALEDAALRRDLPVVGLTPREAEELCGFLGKRLPTDDEWDFAAAFREDGVRARYPWSAGGSGALLADDEVTSVPVGELADGEVGCWPTDEGPSANHRASGRSCPRHTLPVGSYGATFVRRGHGAPLADLAGNVYEWTREPPGSSPAAADHRFPDDTAHMYLRGGNYDAPLQLLENDLRLRVRPEDLERLVPVAGVRCARSLEPDEDLEEVERSLLPPVEPACRAAAE